MKTKSRAKQLGSSLVVVIMITATLMVVVGIAVEYTLNINRHVQRGTTLESALAVGDGAIEILFNNWRTACRVTPTQSLKTSDLSAIATPVPSQFPNLPANANFVKRGVSFDPANDEYNSTYTISNYKVVAVTAEWAALSSANSTPEPALGQSSSNVSSITPTTAATFNYLASADVTLPALGPNGSVVAKVRRLFQREQMSPWNFAIFYVDPLEIHPGPLFTVNGWVHTNSDLYTGHDTLTFADKVTYGSDWNVGFMPGDNWHNGETPASPNYPAGLPPARDQAKQPFGMDSTAIFNSSDANPNNDSYHELIEAPKAGYTDPLAGQRYWDQAGMVIQISDNPNPNQPGNIDGVKGHDNAVLGIPDPNTGALSYVSSGKMYDSFIAALTPNQSLQDNREGATVGVTTLDVGKLFSAPGNSGGMKFFNGIIYISDTSSASNGVGSKRAIRIKNGSVLPSSGLTIASNNPVYIQGDYNTGGTGTAVPSNNPANLNSDGTYINPSNPPAPQVSGYTRVPSSVIADAVNILSNSWTDAESFASLPGSPNASPTTINTAIIAGTVPTAPVGGDGAYSGGAENFPRFLENWANQTFTYYGSMVELYKSQQAIGEWGKGNVYSPPTREWLFDTNFRTNPPPGSIMVYSYIKGRWSVL